MNNFYNFSGRKQTVTDIEWILTHGLFPHGFTEASAFFLKLLHAVASSYTEHDAKVNSCCAYFRKKICLLFWDSMQCLRSQFHWDFHQSVDISSYYHGLHEPLIVTGHCQRLAEQGNHDPHPGAAQPWVEK